MLADSPICVFSVCLCTAKLRLLIPRMCSKPLCLPSLEQSAISINYCGCRCCSKREEKSNLVSIDEWGTSVNSWSTHACKYTVQKEGAHENYGAAFDEELQQLH